MTRLLRWLFDPKRLQRRGKVVPIQLHKKAKQKLSEHLI